MFKKSTACLVALAAFGSITMATVAPVQADGNHGHATLSQRTITVKCARYISKSVIWDRAMPKFLDDLHAYGYSLEEARAIGERVCRDESGVGNKPVMAQTMQNILRSDPPAARR